MPPRRFDGTGTATGQASAIHSALLPAGWHFQRDGDSILISAPANTGPGGKYVRRNTGHLADRILYCLADDLLSAVERETIASPDPDTKPQADAA